MTPGKAVGVRVEVGVRRLEGDTRRNGTLSGQMAVRVVRELPNGDLFLEGTKVVLINNEEYHLYVSGITRPADIASDSSIASSRLADAQIEFTGRGDVAGQQRKGWGSRLLDASQPALKDRIPCSLVSSLPLAALALFSVCAPKSRSRRAPPRPRGRRWSARENQLVGYGIVTGLAGTGDDVSVPFAAQSTLALLAPARGAGRSEAAAAAQRRRGRRDRHAARLRQTRREDRRDRELDRQRQVVERRHPRAVGVEGRRSEVVRRRPRARWSSAASKRAARAAASVKSGVATAGRIPEGALVEREIKSDLAPQGRLAPRAPHSWVHRRVADRAGGRQGALGEGLRRSHGRRRRQRASVPESNTALARRRSRGHARRARGQGRAPRARRHQRTHRHRRGRRRRATCAWCRRARQRSPSR